MESGDREAGSRLRPGGTLLAKSAYFVSFKSFDEDLGCPVFVKVSRPSEDPEVVAVNAAHVALWHKLARMQPVSMPAIRAIDVDDGYALLVTQWIEGQSLRDMLTTTAIRDPGAFVDRFTRQSLIALDALHSQQIVHGDLSPGNILIDTSFLVERVWLIDPAPFGATVSIPGRSDRHVLGTPGWMAPEQRAGDMPDAVSDLFSLGLLLRETARRLGIRPPPVADLLANEAREDRPPSAQAAYWIHDTANTPFPVPRPASLNTIAPETPPDMAERTVFHPAQDATASDGWLPPSRTPSERLESENPPETIDWDSLTGASVASQPPPPNAAPDSDILRSVTAVMRSVPVPRRNAIEKADFVVVAPTPILPGRHFIVELWIAPGSRHAEMLDIALAAGRMKERGGRAFVDLERDTLLRIVLTLPDFDVAAPVETLGWDGDIRNAGFMVKAPAALAPGIYPGMMKLASNDVPFITIQFDLEVAAAERRSPPPRSLDVTLRRIERAFGSYSREDRGEVLRRAQGIKAAGIALFLDVVDVRAGTYWEEHLYCEIDRADGLFLFWSRNAAGSAWVEREWRYALAKHGLDFINPLPLEDPRLAAPPDELKSRHFADMLLFFIDAERSGASRSHDTGPIDQ